jgi:hypothetical protein
MTDVIIPEDYLPIVEGKLWKKILREGDGEQPIHKSNVNGKEARDKMLLFYPSTLWTHSNTSVFVLFLYCS